MKNILNETKNGVEGIAKERTYQYDGEGRVIVNMTIKDDSDFLSVYSQSHTPIISSDVAEFIQNCTDAIPPREQLTLRIHSDCIDENEEELYKQAIKEYYTQKYIKNERELKRNRLIVFFLALFGIMVLAFRLIFDYSIGGEIWSEVIDIVAWVLLWEAVDIGFLGNRALKMKKLQYLSLLNMKIEYLAE